MYYSVFLSNRKKYIHTSVDKMDHQANILQKIKTWMKPNSIVPITLCPIEKEQYELIQRVLELEKQLESVPKARSIPFSWEPR